MPEKTPQQVIKERVWKHLTRGLDPENDECGCIDDIKDNTGYAIDVAILETARAVLEDLWGSQCIDCHSRAMVAKYKEVKKRWLVPVPDPEDDGECDQCGVSSVAKAMCLEKVNIIVPDEFYDTPIGKKSQEEAEKIMKSIEEHQMKRIRRRAYE
jgi:hypothetical protein